MSTAPDAFEELQSIHRVLEQLRREFEAAPNADMLMQLISHQWYRAGLIHEPARVLLEHAELFESLEPKQRQLGERILGHHRLAESGVPIPRRATGSAYTPELGRVMYCVHSAPTYNSNGYSVRTQGVATGIRDSGTDVVVVTRSGYPWDTTTHVEKPAKERTLHELDGVGYVHIPGPNLVATPFDHYVLATADAFVREARVTRPSLIHAASNFRTALPALIAARRLGVPFVYEVRGFWELSEASNRPGWETTPRFSDMVELETLVATESDSVLAITSQIAAELERRGIDGAKITLAANAVDPEQFAPLPKDEHYAAERRIRTDVPVIGYAGSFVEYEGLDTLLEASSLLTRRGVSHQVVLAGSGAAEGALKSKRDQLGLDTVTFLGRLPITEMPQLISAFDIMPLPRTSSRVTELVSPLKPLEAFASGKAVVFSDVAPHKDLAGTTEQRGVLFPAGDAEALADRLEELVADRKRRDELGRAARRWVRDERTWEQLGRTLSGVYAVAAATYQELADEGRSLANLQVALIGSDPTVKALAASVHVTTMDRSQWRTKLEQAPFDLLLVESEALIDEGCSSGGVDQFSAGESPELLGILERCRELGIPCAFWAFGDPLNFTRFRNAPAHFDHVFTTDANLIRPYLQTPGIISRSVSSLPFFAQPAIHNPVSTGGASGPSTPFVSAPNRERSGAQSDTLRCPLNAAAAHGLGIYEGELAHAATHDQLPVELHRHPRECLLSDDVIHMLGSDRVWLNLDLAGDSPTAFSKRVVEAAGCGGVILSVANRGVTETFGGVIPASDDEDVWRALLHDWVTRPGERVREAWFQMRAVYRAHTSDTALTILARTMGLPVNVPPRATYALVVDGSVDATLRAIGQQSVRPIEVFTTRGHEAARQWLSPLGIHVRQASMLALAEADWLGEVSSWVERTRYEDILLATRFGDWNRITAVQASDEDEGRPLARPVDLPCDQSGLVSRELLKESDNNMDRALTARPIEGIELLLQPPVGVKTGNKQEID